MLPNLSASLSAMAALGAVLLLVWLAARGARAAGLGQRKAGGHRLLVLETVALDPRRRLHLVACDDSRVVLLTGGGADVVVGWVAGPPGAGSAPRGEAVECGQARPTMPSEQDVGARAEPGHDTREGAPQLGVARCGVTALVVVLVCVVLLPAAAHAQALAIDLGSGGQAGVTSRIVQLTALIAVLSLAPSLLVMLTAFTRIIIVLSLLRSALSTQGAPPNMVLIGLALFLTFFVMQPVLDQSWTTGLAPMAAGKLGEIEGMRLAAAPFHRFMTSNLRPADLQFFLQLGHMATPPTPAQAPWRAVVPAFIVGELRRAFEMGFLLFLPFLVIDMVVASVLMSLGMMMLPPNVVSLPFKLIFFVMVDGWRLVAGSLVQSFGGG